MDDTCARADSGAGPTASARKRPPDPAEQEWIRRCRNGSRAAYEPLVRRYAAWAEAYAFRRVGDREDARDLAQDAFVRAFHAMPRFRPGAPFLPWFLTILDRLCASHLRSVRRHAALDEIPEPAADGRMDSLDRRLDLERGLSGLPEGQRRVVVLKHLEGLAHHEVAERLSIPAGTAMSRLHTAMRRLRRLLAGAPAPPRTRAEPDAAPAPSRRRNGGTRA